MPPKRTLNSMLLVALLLSLTSFGLARPEPVASQGTADAEAKIENAMSAAPLSIAEEATIMDNELEANGEFIVLREGSNDWYCFPDLPSTPGDDPACYDQTWLDWNYAFFAGEEPNTTVMGVAYMLQGGSDASNTDPFATEPAEGEEWINSPPHIMLLMPEPLDPSEFSTDHHTGGPWIMWAGTPYEHIMMPVADAEQEE
jgi:hypothetical protein